MTSHESDFPAWSPAGGGEEIPASHEPQYDEADQADQGASLQTPQADAAMEAGTDYAGPVPAAEPGVADEPGVIEEDVIVIATQEAAGYGDPQSPADPLGAADPQAGPALGGTPGGQGVGAGQWSEIKAMFVDDPSGSVQAASGLVEKAIESLMASVRQRQDSLASSWRAGDAAGTEELRIALRGYRGLFDELDQIARQFPASQDRVAGGV
jgi:hypothetical protein